MIKQWCISGDERATGKAIHEYYPTREQAEARAVDLTRYTIAEVIDEFADIPEGNLEGESK